MMSDDPNSKRQVAKIARYMGCRGVHLSSEGKWLPCADAETLRRLSTAAEDDSWIKKYEKSLFLLPGGIVAEKTAYTKPKLRESIKNRIMAGSRGGKPGQWSARKAQLVAIEYRKAGGGYRGKKTKKQRSLSKWTKEKWTTSDGKPAIRKGGTRRYLPSKAWSKLTPAQKRATNRKKISGSRKGRQFVANTDAAAKARRSATKSLISQTSTKSIVVQNFSELNGRGSRRKKRGKRWEKLHERGPFSALGTPGLGITSSPGVISASLTKRLYDASDDVKNYLDIKRRSY